MSDPKSDDPVVAVLPLGFPWQTFDPFLFCVHHDDAYPAGNEKLGPATSLAGRNIGQDFAGKDGWRMYHGETVPGFPQHPHRGFETVTIVRRGLLDHSDSLGATARFGRGDVQWLTAGKGIVHCEMFPLVDAKAPNPLELFQIWLNLPARSKMAEPHFTMLWNEQVPRTVLADADGRKSEVAVIAGRFGDIAPLPAPPDSWAAQPEADVAIWTLRMEPGAGLQLPPATLAGTRRTLYFFKGAAAVVGDRSVQGPAAITLDAGVEIGLVAGDTVCEFLLLQGRPIGEPVAQYGPFVMNTQQEIAQAMQDYRRTQFGGWQFDDPAPVHGSEPKRFAKYPDGREETPGA
jgi:redox-sensitive bicupin YhaK (pirin superfamily)